MQSSNIAALATLFVFAAVFAQAAYSLSYDAPDRSKRLFWVDKKADVDASNPDKRLFWVDKKTPEKRLFWVDKKSPEKRLFWVDKKDSETELISLSNIDKIADCMISVVSQYAQKIETECKGAGTLSKSCVNGLNSQRTKSNINCLSHSEGEE
ncbi:uncharacterized protein [Amphiura filiformis]|uniref:uncharacterized protein n=1 Tax=Amphiura filiformis TaxID=82378 RepID=UPI003B222EEE